MRQALFRATFLLVLAAIAIVPETAPAFDGRSLGQRGTLSLADLKHLWARTPRLKREIEKEVRAQKKTPERIVCIGARFSGQWTYLGGERVSPFVCDFGSKSLHLNWRVSLRDAEGRMYESQTQEAMQRARSISQTRPTWRWTAPDHSEEP